MGRSILSSWKDKFIIRRIELCLHAHNMADDKKKNNTLLISCARGAIPELPSTGNIWKPVILKTLTLLKRAIWPKGTSVNL